MIRLSDDKSVIGTFPSPKSQVQGHAYDKSNKPNYTQKTKKQ